MPSKTPEEEAMILDRSSHNVLNAVVTLVKEMMADGMSQKEILTMMTKENNELMNKMELSALVAVLAIHIAVTEQMPTIE